jgi:creatinine amidohydrolase
MLKKYEQVSYELLRPEQIRSLRGECPIIYVPAGSLEWHGWHNPLGTDALKAHAICCEAALKHGGVVLSPFYQGLVGSDNWGPDGWRGYTQAFNEEEMFEAAMTGIVRAMVYGQWKVIAGVTGHDHPAQRDAMQRAIDVGTRGANVIGFSIMEGDLHESNDDIPYTMDHAATWETSCMMYAYPEKVDLDALRQRLVSTEDCLDMFGPEGVGGPNPLKYASPELGRKIVQTMGDLIGKKARATLAGLETP